MDGDKYVRLPIIRVAAHRLSLAIGIFRLPCEVVALQDAALAPCRLEVVHDECADLSRHVALTQAAVRVHRAGIVFFIMPRVDKYFHLRSSFLFSIAVRPR